MSILLCMSIPPTWEVSSRIFSPSDRVGSPCLSKQPAQGLPRVPHLCSHLLPDGLVVADRLGERLHMCIQEGYSSAHFDYPTDHAHPLILLQHTLWSYSSTPSDLTPAHPLILLQHTLWSYSSTPSDLTPAHPLILLQHTLSLPQTPPHALNSHHSPSISPLIQTTHRLSVTLTVTLTPHSSLSLLILTLPTHTHSPYPHSLHTLTLTTHQCPLKRVWVR